MKVFKVFYQENSLEIPVRENTRSLYVEANSIPEVIKYLENRKYNIEFIEEIKGDVLEFEKQSVDFKLERIDG